MSDTPDTAPSFPVTSQASVDGFDLGELTSEAGTINWSAVRKRCAGAAAPNEIVVCASDPEAERLGAISGVHGFEPPPETPGRLAWKLGDVDMDVHVESATMPSGVVSKRVMVGAKIKF